MHTHIKHTLKYTTTQLFQTLPSISNIQKAREKQFFVLRLVCDKSLKKQNSD